jgi:thiamine transport system permease protein
LIAAGLLAAIVAASLAGLVAAGGGSFRAPSPYLWSVARGAALQAALSTALSLVLGTALALALTRRAAFPGRGLFFAALTAAAVAPTIVIIFGVVAAHGRSGPISAAAAWLGLPAPPPVYGLGGVVLAHVAMNAPLVARVMLGAFGALPAERSRLALMLRFSGADCFRHLDLPAIRREWPGLAAFVFLLCFTSFAVVLALGGGPANATLEVAIYQALRLEVDFTAAASIAGLQIALCLGFVLLFGLAGGRLPDNSGQIAAAPRADAGSAALKAFDMAVIALAGALILPIMLSVLGGAARLDSLADAQILRAALTSVALAAIASCVAVGLGLLLAAAAAAPLIRRSQRQSRLIELGVLALVALPPFALVAGLFALLRGAGSLVAIGFVLVPLVNALAALPFVFRLLAPPLAQSADRHGRLAASLGLEGWTRLRVVAWPTLKRPLTAAFALSAALSLGDFGVIALFGGGDLVTLPYLMAERLGAYRIEEAGAVALALVAFAGSLAYAADRA